MANTELQERILEILPGRHQAPMRTSRVALHAMGDKRHTLATATALRGLEGRGLVEWGWRDSASGELIKEWRRL